MTQAPGTLNGGAGQSNDEAAPAYTNRRLRTMIRFVLRLIGFVFLAAGFVFLIYDGMKSIGGNMVFITRLEQTWADINQDSLAQLKPAIEKHAAAWLWDPVVRTILEQPTWAVLGVIGAVFILLGRKKKPLIGYARD